MNVCDRLKTLAEIEERLFTALHEAKEAFELARLEFILEKYCGDGRTGKGSASLQSATNAYNMAVKRYREALVVFNDFVIRRQLPPEWKREQP